MAQLSSDVSTNAFTRQPEPCEPVETDFRKIVTDLPAPGTLEGLAAAARLFPGVNCYQPAIQWDRADGFQVYDGQGNCWIDFSSTAVMTNTGHGHPAIRAALAEHVENGLLAQFSYASAIRVELAERLLELAPAGMEKVYFWTVGSEAIEASLRLVREWGMKQNPEKYHVLTFAGDYHGWTLGAHQLSGETAKKPWLPNADSGIHHIPFPHVEGEDHTDWAAFLRETLAEVESQGVEPGSIAAVFIEAMQGLAARPFPVEYMRALREWADEHNVMLVFDEIQTGFGRTGKLFAHEHYGIRPDLLCIGKGVTSTLPLAAVLGPAEVLDLLPPAAITTTHAAHPLSCAAALANLKVIEDEGLVEAAAQKGEVVRSEVKKLQQRFPELIEKTTGMGLLHAVHLRNPETGKPDLELARNLNWAAVKRGVMLIQTGRSTIKICPPLVIPDEAIIDGIAAIGEGIERSNAFRS